jgi:hypothetical protein
MLEKEDPKFGFTGVYLYSGLWEEMTYDWNTGELTPSTGVAQDTFTGVIAHCLGAGIQAIQQNGEYERTVMVKRAQVAHD